MKFLGDMGVARCTLDLLRERGHDAANLLDQGLERLPDEAILNKARQEGRIVITFDLDFGDLLSAGGDTLPSVILFRLRRRGPSEVNPRLLQVIAECADDLRRGAILVVEPARYRVRRLPIRRKSKGERT